MLLPEIFYVSMFIGTLRPDSSIRDRIQLLVTDSGQDILFDNVINVFHTWLRDQEIQRSNDSTFHSFRPGKVPRESKAMLMYLEDQRQIRGCTKAGMCYQCYKKSGDMTVMWKDCTRHNKSAKEKASKEAKGTDIKTKNIKLDLSSLLSEATLAIQNISEKEDLSSLYYHDIDPTLR